MATSTRPARRGGGATDQENDTYPTPMSQTRVEAVEHRVPEETAESSESTAGHPRAAADKATRHNSTQVSVPFLGTVKLPAADELAFIGGVTGLAVVGMIEWPVAVVLGAGHALATRRRDKVVREFGEALEEA